MAEALTMAYFISSHGLGHAARAAAVMEAIYDRNPSIRFEIFTLAPEWFFKETLSGAFKYHAIRTDVGLAQRTPFHEDLSDTLTDLDAFFPFSPEAIQPIARRLKENGCCLVLCDISPMGICAGTEARIPSVLVENFTWDWIYQAYSDAEPKFLPHIQYLKTIFAEADYHVQTEPVCCYQDTDLTALPIARKPRSAVSRIRQNLGIDAQRPVVHITMGGIPQQYTIGEALKAHPDLIFIISGSGQTLESDGNVFTLPYHSTFYHTDIIHAADLVIGKAGYSTLAEVYYAGIPFIFVKRPMFRESAVISKFVRTHMHGMDITLEQFERGEWIGDLRRLLQKPVVSRTKPTGADQVAEFIFGLL